MSYFCTPFWQKNGNPKRADNQIYKSLLCFSFALQISEEHGIQNYKSVMAEETKQSQVEDSNQDLEVQEVAGMANESQPEPENQQENPEKFLKDFNWHNYDEGIDPIDDSKLEEFEKLVAENFVDTLDDEVVTGRVINLTDRDAIIDINAKSEGVISLNEFRYNPDLKEGDEV